MHFGHPNADALNFTQHRIGMLVLWWKDLERSNVLLQLFISLVQRKFNKSWLRLESWKGTLGLDAFIYFILFYFISFAYHIIQREKEKKRNEHILKQRIIHVNIIRQGYHNSGKPTIVVPFVLMSPFFWRPLAKSADTIGRSSLRYMYFFVSLLSCGLKCLTRLAKTWRIFMPHQGS